MDRSGSMDRIPPRGGRRRRLAHRPRQEHLRQFILDLPKGLMQFSTFTTAAMAAPSSTTTSSSRQQGADPPRRQRAAGPRRNADL
jgi:hypothetical protein